ncbi:MAG: DNA recombination protein RmuC [Anaerolineae bacterium]
MVETLLVIMIVVQALCLVGVTYYLTRRVRAAESSAELLRHVAGAVQQGQVQSAEMAQQLRGLTPLAESLTALRSSVAGMQGQLEARARVEQQAADAVGRLERVLVGSQSRGAAGENAVEHLLAQLPAEWQVRNWRSGNKVVEFGLRLPDGAVLPIDCKWTGAELLERLDAAQTPIEARRAKERLVATVVQRAREVAKYVDPQTTAGLGIAVVPDGVYAHCREAQAELIRERVVVIGQSLLLPYLLLVFQAVLAAARDVDLQRLNAALDSCLDSLGAAQDEVQGRLSRAMVLLENSRSALSANLAEAAAALSSVRRLAFDLSAEVDGGEAHAALEAEAAADDALRDEPAARPATDDEPLWEDERG